MTYVLGLTGSIGMGKSTTADMFKEQGVPVWEADAAVHQIYAENQDVIAKISSLIPRAYTKTGLDRAAMRSALQDDPSLLKKIEAVVHPAVAEHRLSFIQNTKDQPLIVLDVPLLFEIGAYALCDGVLVVSIDSETQRKRVLDRGTMAQADLDLILSKQMPDSEKREKADFVIETYDLETTRAEVNALIEKLTSDSHSPSDA